ncbi:hypothetical protein BDN72DRAFT_922341 [Pluteus cervinus]|uniref:Uncharacterized protein n=1 Tax=Pluteus cervinus TaxID=181527 RepID=A0ACD3AH66_9AGAR|nr:hypothetical protein BDN72DRAFT_922341 [Pluteus cervinus]
MPSTTSIKAPTQCKEPAGCPIDNIPMKFLQQIFILADKGSIPSPTEVRMEKPIGFNLMQVSQRWKEAARLTPDLWTRITIYHPNDDTLLKTQLCLTHSNNQPLEVVINQRKHKSFFFKESPRGIADTFDRIIPHLHCCRLLESYEPIGETAIIDRLCALGPNDLPNLKEIVFNATNWVDGAPKFFEMLRTLPSLRRLEWDGGLPNPSTLTAVSGAGLTKISLGRIHMDEAISLLKATPQVVEFRVIGLFEANLSQWTAQRVTLLNLKTLNIGGCDRAQSLFDHLRLPSLKVLTLCESHPNIEDTALLRLLSTSHCILTSLHLGLGDFTELDLHKRLARLSDRLAFLKQLEVDLRGNDNYLTQESFKWLSPVPMLFFPKLISLRLRVCQVTMGDIADMVQARSNNGAPLQSLKLETDDTGYESGVDEENALESLKAALLERGITPGDRVGQLRIALVTA